MPRSDDHLTVLKKVENNAYRIEFLHEMGNISATFNVGDMIHYVEDPTIKEDTLEDENDLRGSILKEGID